MGDLLVKKLQITKNMAHELHELPRIGATSKEKLLISLVPALF